MQKKTQNEDNTAGIINTENRLTKLETAAPSPCYSWNFIVSVGDFTFYEFGHRTEINSVTLGGDIEWVRGQIKPGYSIAGFWSMRGSPAAGT